MSDVAEEVNAVALEDLGGANAWTEEEDFVENGATPALADEETPLNDAGGFGMLNDGAGAVVVELELDPEEKGDENGFGVPRLFVGLLPFFASKSFWACFLNDVYFSNIPDTSANGSASTALDNAVTIETLSPRRER